MVLAVVLPSKCVHPIHRFHNSCEVLCCSCLWHMMFASFIWVSLLHLKTEPRPRQHTTHSRTNMHLCLCHTLRIFVQLFVFFILPLCLLLLSLICTLRVFQTEQINHIDSRKEHRANSSCKRSISFSHTPHCLSAFSRPVSPVSLRSCSPHSPSFRIILPVFAHLPVELSFVHFTVHLMIPLQPTDFLIFAVGFFTVFRFSISVFWPGLCLIC